MFFRAKSSNNCNCLSPAWEVSFPFSRHKHTTKISAAISSVKLAPAEHGSCLHRHNGICFTVSSQLLPSQSSVTEAVPRPCHKCSESHALVRRLAAGQTPEATRSVMSVHRKWIQTSERTKRTRRARHMDLGHLGMYSKSQPQMHPCNGPCNLPVVTMSTASGAPRFAPWAIHRIAFFKPCNAP